MCIYSSTKSYYISNYHFTLLLTSYAIIQSYQQLVQVPIDCAINGANVSEISERHWEFIRIDPFSISSTLHELSVVLEFVAAGNAVKVFSVPMCLLVRTIWCIISTHYREISVGMMHMLTDVTTRHGGNIAIFGYIEEAAEESGGEAGGNDACLEE